MCVCARVNNVHVCTRKFVYVNLRVASDDTRMMDWTIQVNASADLGGLDAVLDGCDHGVESIGLFR
jgi:hypothetical protein